MHYDFRSGSNEKRVDRPCLCISAGRRLMHQSYDPGQRALGGAAIGAGTGAAIGAAAGGGTGAAIGAATGGALGAITGAATTPPPPQYPPPGYPPPGYPPPGYPPYYR